MKISIHQLSDKELLLNLYLTHVLSFFLSGIGIFFLFVRQGKDFGDNFALWSIGSDLLLGGGVAVVIIALNLWAYRFLPQKYWDDGGVNQKLFAERNFFHIVLIAAVVSFSEEVLFRGVIQAYVGVFWTAVLFTLLHTRYLKQWPMFVFVFMISLLFGWLVAHTGRLWPAVISHFAVDAVMGILIQRRVVSYGDEQ